MPTITHEVPVQAVTAGPQHHFFGYYEKCPWDATGRYLLALETPLYDREPEANDSAVIGLIDTQNNHHWQPLAATAAWNWQQGTMLHWLGTTAQIIYNRRTGDHFESVIQDVHTGAMRVLPRPVYTVNRAGTQAFSLNFARLHRTRPGYGYAGVADPTAGDPHPADDGIYSMDLTSGAHQMILSLHSLAQFQPLPSMQGAEHWFNHIQINPEGTRIAFLHRWHVGEGWHTRLLTANPDGSDLYCVTDHEYFSHYDWYDTTRLLGWSKRYDRGNHYFLYTDQDTHHEILGEEVFNTDGHCSYSPDRHWLLTDTGPDSERKRTLMLYHLDTNTRYDIARLYTPAELNGPTRCDLHPRWSRDGRQVCIDSAHEHMRQLYVLDVGEIIDTVG